MMRFDVMPYCSSPTPTTPPAIGSRQSQTSACQGFHITLIVLFVCMLFVVVVSKEKPTR
jgi:hypothetical protein